MIQLILVHLILLLHDPMLVLCSSECLLQVKTSHKSSYAQWQPPVTPKLRKHIATKVLLSNDVCQDTSGRENLVYDPGRVQEIGTGNAECGVAADILVGVVNKNQFKTAVRESGTQQLLIKTKHLMHILHSVLEHRQQARKTEVSHLL